MVEMKSLTLNGTKYDSFVDVIARAAIEKFKQNGTGGNTVSITLDRFENKENSGVSITVTKEYSDGSIVDEVVFVYDGKNGAASVPGIGDSSQNANYEPAEEDIPKVFITGVKPTTKDDVLAEMQYISKTDNFNAYLFIKCQGTSSMSHPKKNFTVKLYSDEARETKLKKAFKNWNHESNKFVLKANYIDHAHARNIVSARLWGEVVASRPDYASLPVEMRNSPNNGAVDGFPIKIYYNGNYEGIYTWNIGKDDWMWGMDDDNPNHVLLCAEGNTDGVYKETTSNFRALWNGVDGQKPGWSVEVGTNSTALKNSLNALIKFVMDNDGDAFRNGIGKYLDIQSAIDYYIFQYEICGLDGLAHNMLLATYDGKLWRCGAYDMDSTFGLWWDGSKFVSATFACPEDYQERYSLLWERIEANFTAELKARQAELRKTVLSYPNMVAHFERFIDVIGSYLYAEDLTIYTGIPSGNTNNIKQIRNYIRDRQAYVDAEFAAMDGSAPDVPEQPDVPDNPEPSEIPCTSVLLSATSLTFDDYNTQRITATLIPSNTTDVVSWVSSNTSVATVLDGVVTPISDGNTTITASAGSASATCGVSVAIPEVPEIIEPGEDGTVNIDLTAGKIIEMESGEYIDHTGGCGSRNYIELNQFVYCIYNISNGAWYSVAYYDENKQYISGDSKAYRDPSPVIAPDSAKYMRVSVANAVFTNVTVAFKASAVTWSDTATNKITSTGEVQTTGGDAYLSSRVDVPDGATIVYLFNIRDGSYIWKEVATYDANGTFLKKYSDDGKVSEVKITNISNIAFVQATAFPNSINTNIDPNNQLYMVFV